jgi:YhcH/YjgK/YiaL family protein
MICASLDYVSRYRSMHPRLAAGLEYIAQVQPDVSLGRYPLMEGVYAIVSEYETKGENPGHFEAHQKVIDIQYPVIGRERVPWCPIADMRVRTPYDPERDVTWYEGAPRTLDVVIGCGVFAVFFPEDGHNPQRAAGAVEQIKKVTIKVAVF